MVLTTDLNQTPYFDDFDESKNFHKILFKAGTAVQARELTQLQTILQNQVERFGSNILVEGTIIKGGSFTEIENLGFAKILDLQTNGQPVVMSNYVDLWAKGSVSGVTAKVVLTEDGLETQSPNLNTLYIKYTDTSTTAGHEGEKVFRAGETINLYSDRDLTSLEYSVTVATVSVDSVPVGSSYATQCSSGILYQKGFFIGFEAQTTIVSKYDTTPDSIVVGFRTAEEIISSSNDTSLLDNANGFNNYNAPGADRLKLTPSLVALSKTEADTDETFFAIQEYNNGRLVRRNTDTQLNSINKVIAKRTSEESGDYSLSTPKIIVKDDSSNTSLLNIEVDPATYYVDGNRIEFINKNITQINKSTEYDTATQQDVLGNYGKYLIVDNYVGEFDFTTQGDVLFYDTAVSANTTVGLSADANNVIGTGKIRSVTRNGTNDDSYRLYMYNVKMDSGKNFRKDVKACFGVDGSNNVIGVADAVLTDGLTKFTDATFNSLVFPIGREAIKSIDTTDSDYVYRTSATGVVATDGTITISTSSGEIFPYGASATLSSDSRAEIMLICNETVDSYTKGQPISLSTATATTNSTADQLTLDISTGTLSTDMDVIIFYNVKSTAVKPIGKRLETVYVKVDISTHENGADIGKYSLGMPDVYSIEKVTRGSTYSESNADITNKFVLVKNDRAGYYGHSYVKKVRSYTLSETVDTNLLFKLKVFVKDTSSPFSQSFFSVDSYPVDDTSTILPDDKIRTENIPSFKTRSGSVLNLRDCLDFRPYVVNVAAYSSTIAGATVHDNSPSTDNLNKTFGTSELKIIAPNKSAEITYDYYLSRRDRLVMTSKGDFFVVSGVSDTEPAVPNIPSKSMLIADLYIPAFPSLSSKNAWAIDKPLYGVRVSTKNNRRYTMRDIGAIESRIDRIEYYTALNTLEKRSADLIITDENGNDRFKNGILVDNFYDLQTANLSDDLFKAGLDRSYGEITPSFRKYNLGLKPKSVSNVTDFDEVATLNKTDTEMLSQTSASTYRNCATDFYKYTGSARLNPEYDSAPSVTQAPVVNIDVDIASAISDFSEAIGEFVPLSRVDSSSVSSTLVETLTNGLSTTTTSTTTTSTTTNSESLQIDSNINTTKVGDFVTDVSFSPYLRGRKVEIFATGLRPNTRFYFYFDGVDINDKVAPAKETSKARLIRRGRKLSRIRPFGSEVTSNSSGVLRAIFKLPDGEFAVGDRNLLIADVDSLGALSAASSTATAVYRGFNFSYETTGLQATTRVPSFSTVSSSSTSTTVNSTTTTVNTPDWFFGGGGGSGDPISQTFFIDRNDTSDSFVMLTKLDLFFKSKSSVEGVTVQIRTTDNGYPTKSVLPFSSIHLEPSDVNVSDDSSVATTITFEAPISLRAGLDYAIVIIPDASNPDYTVWVSKTGEKDVITGRSINRDANPAGVLFTSTNNSAWSPIQDENMKMVIYKAQFTSSSGYMDLTNRDHEFLTLSEYAGNFERGETVFVESSNLAGTISANAESQSIVGTSTTFTTTFSVGDNLVYVDGSNREVFTIASITDDTNLTIEEYPSTSNTSANYFKSIIGDMDYFNSRDDIRLVLENSSASAEAGVFEANNTIIGADSGATGVIQSVDSIPVSYVQPQIYRSDFATAQCSLTATALSDGSSNYLTSPMSLSFSDNKHFNVTETSIKSKSLEGGTDSFVTRVNLNSTASPRDVSPLLDYSISSIDAYEFIVNNDNTDEDTDSEGAAKVRYISKTVELAEGMDAEDLKVWLTAYKPPASNVLVYGKFKASEDITPFEEIPWTLMEVQSNYNFTSSNANRYDYKEFSYNIPEGTATAGNGARIDPSAGNIKYISQDGTIFTDYKYFAVKIVLLSEGGHRIPRVKDMRSIALSV